LREHNQMVEKIDHIGIVVKDLDKAIEVYSNALELKPSHVESMDELNLRLSFLPVGESMIELIQPTGNGMYQEFLEQHGEGIHHICYKVDNIDTAMENAKKHLRFRDRIPRAGGGGSRIAFLESVDIFNTETEFVER
jgi:methylmalonyl-CoA/ethylmalonyl-CoA epimerase